MISLQVNLKLVSHWEQLIRPFFFHRFQKTEPPKKTERAKKKLRIFMRKNSDYWRKIYDKNSVFSHLFALKQGKKWKLQILGPKKYYTANILPVLSASITCVLIVHCKLHRNTTCTTNILTLPIKLYWYDQWFYCIHSPSKTLVTPVKNKIATNKIYWQYKLKTLAIPLKNYVPTNEKYW